MEPARPASASARVKWQRCNTSERGRSCAARARVCWEIRRQVIRPFPLLAPSYYSPRQIAPQAIDYSSRRPHNLPAITSLSSPLRPLSLGLPPGSFSTSRYVVAPVGCTIITSLVEERLSRMVEIEKGAA